MIRLIFGIILLFWGLFGFESEGNTFIIIIAFLFIFAGITALVKKNEREQQLIKVNANNGKRTKLFKTTKRYGDLQIDEDNNLFMIADSPEIFKFDELSNFKLYQDNTTISSGTRGMALNLGLGIMVGGTSESTSSITVEKIDLVYVTTGKNGDRYTYKLLPYSVQQSSEQYRITIEKAEEMVRGFESILNS